MNLYSLAPRLSAVGEGGSSWTGVEPHQAT